MAIFISYSHKDKDFVDTLATSLVEKRIPVFVDRWEMKVGDSITSKIQTAITDASYLIVVLSKNSVASDWCNREINSGLVLELEKKRVVILPALLEDCDIPLFLKDKFFADFRTSFNTGFKLILESVASLVSENNGRLYETENYFTDFTSSCGIRGQYFEYHIDTVDFSIEPDKPYTILTNIIFVANKTATKRYKKQYLEGKGSLMANMIVMLCAEDENISGQNAHLLQDIPFETTFQILDPINDLSFKAYVTIKRLGILDGKDKIYYFGNIFTKMLEDIKTKK